MSSVIKTIKTKLDDGTIQEIFPRTPHQAVFNADTGQTLDVTLDNLLNQITEVDVRAAHTLKKDNNNSNIILLEREDGTVSSVDISDKANINDIGVIKLTGSLSNRISAMNLEPGIYRINGSYKVSDLDTTEYLSTGGDLVVVEDNNVLRLTGQNIEKYSVSNGVLTKETYLTDVYLSQHLSTLIDARIDEKIQGIDSEKIQSLFN